MVADGKSSPLVSLLGGGIAGGVEAFSTYPFEFAKTRVQLYGHGGIRNPFRIVGQVVKEEGFTALYKGCSTMIVVSLAGGQCPMPYKTRYLHPEAHTMDRDR